MEQNLLMRFVFLGVFLVALVFGYHYFTTKTEIGADFKEGAKDVIFNIFTQEYDNNAEGLE